VKSLRTATIGEGVGLALVVRGHFANKTALPTFAAFTVTPLDRSTILAAFQFRRQAVHMIGRGSCPGSESNACWSRWACYSKQISELLKLFFRDDDTVEDRRAVQHHLRRMGLGVHVDGAEGRLGLQVGDGAIGWQPLAPVARRAALEDGMVNPAYARETTDGQGHQ